MTQFADDEDFPAPPPPAWPPKQTMTSEEAVQMLNALSGAAHAAHGPRPPRDRWRNPLPDPQRVVFATGIKPPFATVVWSPGQIHEIDRDWRRAIHQIHEGKIIGGGAPSLIREGQRAGVHPAILSDGDSVMGPNSNPGREVNGHPVSR